MRYCVMFLAVGLLAAQDASRDDAARKDLQKFDGNWELVSYTVDGKTASEAERKAIKLTVRDAVSTFTKGKDTSQGTYVVDALRKPKTLDIVLLDGPNKGKVERAIYDLDGDNLKIALSAPGKDRPAEFISKPGVTLEVWKRERLIAKAPEKKAQPKPKAPMTTAKAPPPPPKPPAPSPFTDKALEEAVRGVLQHVKSDYWNEENLNNVYVLEAPGKGIKNLHGLEKCKNLSLLKLSNNQISDISPLRELTNLQSLDLAGNQIVDVSPLAGLNKLQYLELSNNQVSHVEPLGGLASMTSLYLSNNRIADITPLGRLTKLWSIHLGHNQVSDLAPLAKQTELSMLLLERNKITDLTPLVTMCKADAAGEKRFAPYLRVFLAGNPLSDAAKKEQISALKAIGVRVE